MGMKKALKKTLADNPMGLSEESAKKLIIMSQKALGLLNKKPQQIGMALGIGIALLTGGAYFLAGRFMVIPMIPLAQAPLIADGLGALAALGAGYLAGRFYTGQALKKSLNALFAR